MKVKKIILLTLTSMVLMINCNTNSINKSSVKPYQFLLSFLSISILGEVGQPKQIKASNDFIALHRGISTESVNLEEAQISLDVSKDIMIKHLNPINNDQYPCIQNDLCYELLLNWYTSYNNLYFNSPILDESELEKFKHYKEECLNNKNCHDKHVQIIQEIFEEVSKSKKLFKNK